MQEKYPDGIDYTPDTYPSFHSGSRLKDQTRHYDQRWLQWGQSNVTFGQLNDKPLKEYR